MHRGMRVGLVGAMTVPLLAVALVTGTAAAATPRYQPSNSPVVVVSGLNNPRQLALTDHGRRLLIAEAGKGGNLASLPSPEGGTTYVGDTGSISAVWGPRRAQNHSAHRIVTGLMSGAAQDG